MKKSYTTDIAILLILVIGISIICLFLPTNVPIHFDVHGKADIIVNKYYLLVGVVIPYTAYWKFLRGSKKKPNH